VGRLPYESCHMDTWNRWREEEKLLQLAGHLRGKALQEWNLISFQDHGSFDQAN